MGELFIVNAGTVIGDFDPDHFVAGAVCADNDLFVFTVELQRVSDKVINDFGNAEFVGVRQ